MQCLLLLPIVHSDNNIPLGMLPIVIKCCYGYYCCLMLSSQNLLRCCWSPDGRKIAAGSADRCLTPSLSHLHPPTITVTPTFTHSTHPPTITLYSPSHYHTLLTLPLSHSTHPPTITLYPPSHYHSLLTLPLSHSTHPPTITLYSPTHYHTLLTLPLSHSTHPPTITPSHYPYSGLSMYGTQ